MSAYELHCKSCGVAWRDHLGATGICAKLVEAQAEIDRLRGEIAKRPPINFITKDGCTTKSTLYAGASVWAVGDDGEPNLLTEFTFTPDGCTNGDTWWAWDEQDQKWRPVDTCYSTREAAIASKPTKGTP